MSYIDQFLHKLNLIPPQADQLLRQIRQLDKQVQQIKVDLQPKKESLLEKMKLWEDKKTAKGHNELELQYREIVVMENQMHTKTKEKIQISEKLYNFIHEPTEKLDRELHLKGFDRQYDEDLNNKKKRGKKAIKKGVKRAQWEYDPNEPKYCYCGKPSFGEMVMCQNTYCDREWFHLECIDQKRLPDKWFCMDCRENVPKNTSSSKAKPKSKQ